MFLVAILFLYHHYKQQSDMIMLSICMLCIIITADTLHDFVIETLSSHSSRVEKCATVKAALKLGETKFISCRPSVTGSVVRIRLTGQKAAVLTLCEVKIYGAPW